MNGSRQYLLYPGLTGAQIAARAAPPDKTLPIVAKREWARLRAWLFLWILLANAGISLLWLFGSPPRSAVILVTSAIGLLVRGSPALIKRMGFIAALLASVIVFVAQLFSLTPATILSSLDVLPEMRPTAAPEYLVAAAGLIAIMVLGWWSARRDMAFETGTSLSIALGLTLAWSVTDAMVTISDKGSYQRDARDAVFQSAVQSSGFARHDGDRRNLVLIDVEAMGLPRDPTLLRTLFKHLTSGAMRQRYEVRQGATRFYGSTVTSEVRELCGRWGGYDELLVHADPTCLPMALRRDGYETTAMHGFTPQFYDRARWYPNAGLDRLLFRRELMALGAGKCPGLFPGACDRDIPTIIARQLKGAHRPQFIHWVTLNSHFPVPSIAALHTDRCERFDPDLAEQGPMACRMVQIWSDIFARLATEMTAVDFPSTDVLIVGDHRPPFYDRRQRAMFSADQVPWIMLRHRGR